MCPSPHNIGPNPPNMVKHSALSIVPTEYIEKIHQLLLLIFLRPRSVTGNLGSECKYRVLGPDYSINPPEYKSFKAFCEPFDLSLSYVKTSCQLPLQHLVPLRYPRMSAKSPFWPTVMLEGQLVHLLVYPPSVVVHVVRYFILNFQNSNMFTEL